MKKISTGEYKIHSNQKKINMYDKQTSIDEMIKEYIHPKYTEIYSRMGEIKKCA